MIVGAVGVLAFGGVTACADDSSTESDSGSTSALPSNPATGDPVKIGFITPEGGAVSLPMVREGGEAAVEYLNNNGGGIGGHKVDLIVCTQQEEPASATNCANQMVEQGVSAVVSPLGAQGAVMLPIVTGAGIPFIAQAPVSQVEMMSPNSYMLSGGIVSILGGQAATAAKDGVKKVALFVGDSGDAASSLGMVGNPIFQQAGVELEIVTIPNAVADPTPQITAGLASNPDAVSIVGDTRLCTSAIKALQSVAPDVQKYLIASCLDAAVVDSTGVDAIAGAKAFTTVVLDSDEPTVELYKSVMAEYAPDTDLKGLGYLGYQVMMSLGEVGKSLTGPVTPESFKTALSTAKDVPMPAAPGLTFTCDGTAVPVLTALCSKSILVSTVESDGTLSETVPVNT
ncbi:ABC transporter substrate-binding protein [Rhodococcus triatomae]|nr:branched-chain amino acid ABC transporter substrate -binding protein [Rhodococcus triatomae BKS 15-14]